MSSSAEQERVRRAMAVRTRDAHFRRRRAVQGESDSVTGRLLALPRGAMGTAYDDVPLVEPADVDLQQLRGFPAAVAAACRGGPVHVLADALAVHGGGGGGGQTPAFLHHGLVLALAAGHVEAAELLLARGAPVLRATPQVIVDGLPSSSSSSSSSPALSVDRQVALFAVLQRHGWTPNTPGHYGRVLLPTVAAHTGRGDSGSSSSSSSLALLRWFLDHGADPHRGVQADCRDRGGPSDTASGQALEAAAGRGSAAAVAVLLQAGARLHYGFPLHVAAGAVHRPSSSLQAARATDDFDVQRLQAMQVLVAAGADVNQARTTRHMQPDYPLIAAITAGAADRVRWLLRHGADPHRRGRYGSAVEWAQKAGDEAVRQAMAEVRAEEALAREALATVVLATEVLATEKMPAGDTVGEGGEGTTES